MREPPAAAPPEPARDGRPASSAAETGRPDVGISRPAWVEIDLDALEANLELLRLRAAPAQVLAVIKADAYGHGGKAVARALEGARVDWLGVALLEEGMELRRAGVRTPVLVLGPGRGRQLPLYQRYRLTPAISSLEQLREWADAAASARAAGAGPAIEPQPFHLKVDTGMTRLGLAVAELDAAWDLLRTSPALRLTGVLSHLAEADDLASPRSAEQEERFAVAVERIRARLEARSAGSAGELLVHLANSAAALHHPASRLTLVRAGMALYGYDPVGELTGLRPVMAVVSRIVQVRAVPAGTRVSYGGRWEASRPSRIAVVPVGYADGYPWRLGNRAEALAGGRRVPVIGAVTMDMVLLDITDASTEDGDRVVLLGRQGEAEVSAVELAERAGTIPYEILCQLGLRLPRRYRRDGREIAYESRFSREWP